MPIKHIRSFLIAKTYDFAMRNTEQSCLQQWRVELLQYTAGEILEIGAGTGLNLPHYPETANRLTLSEPDWQMRQQLKKRVAETGGKKITITSWSADKIAAADQSFDNIIATLVLCSVADQKTSLTEIFRLLRPNGQLIFLEHVISDHPPTRRWQQRLEPFWSICAGDCKLTRDTAAAIESSGLIIEQLIDAPMIGTPSFVSRTIRGSARKPPTIIA